MARASTGKLRKGVINLLKNPKTPFIATGIVLYILGVFSGWIIAGWRQDSSTGNTQTHKNTQRSSGPSSSATTSSATERLNKSYNNAKDRVARDEKSKKVTARQAILLRSKIEELYKAKSGNIAENDEAVNTAKQRSQSRQALRQWLKANNLSIVYFAGLY